MGLLSVFLVLIVLGVVLYLVKAYVPMDPPIRTVLTVVVVLALCIWLLRVFGVANVPALRL
jgi:hypothetical protein